MTCRLENEESWQQSAAREVKSERGERESEQFIDCVTTCGSGAGRQCLPSCGLGPTGARRADQGGWCRRQERREKPGENQERRERERASTRKERERPEERSRRRRHLLSCLRRHQSQIRATERERFATFRRRSSLSLLTHVKCPRHAQVSGRPLLPSRRPTLVIPKQILLRLL